jgi:phosphoenolpyruvate carboxylase
LLDFKKVKENALNEINSLTKNKITEELKKVKINNIDEVQNVIEKILNYHISPIFIETINNNKKKINEILIKNENEKINEEDTQFEINELINSSLSLWKKTILNSKTLIVIKEVLSYIKLTTVEEKNYKKKEKNKIKLQKLLNKYQIN